MRRAATAAVASLALLAVAGCTPDVTRQRVESDVTRTFSNQLQRAEQIRGATPRDPHASAECHRNGVNLADKGPGSWICMISYRVPPHGTKRGVWKYGVGVGGDDCYTATNGKLVNAQTILDDRTRQQVANPLYQFDGCFDVYDGKTSLTR